MIYFKAKKNFPFGNSIPVIIEVSHSAYNFLTNEWSLATHYYLNEDDLVANKVKMKISEYIIEKGVTLPEEKLSSLIENYIDKPEITPVYSKTVTLFLAPKEGEYPLAFDKIETLKVFLLKTLQANSSLLEVIPASLTVYDESLFRSKVSKAQDSAINS